MSEAPSTAPVCYRHPSRETLLSCSRCDRPICTSCMNDAVVGHHCPDCVKEGRRSQRPARTAFGGSRAGRLGYVCQAIIAVNVLFLIASAILGGPQAIAGGGGWFGLLGIGTPVTQWGAVLGYAGYGGEIHGVASGEWYRLVTAMFINYGAVHLLLNMSLVATMGRYLERQLGPARFLALYLLAGFGGNVAAYVFQPPFGQSAGASTATFGLIIAVIVINRRMALDVGPVMPLLITNLLFTFTVPGISVAGHLGGLAVGAAAAAVLAYAKMPRRALKQVIGLVAVLLLILAAVVLRTMALLNIYG
ncbi:rhomboid family intramembrane serine protease [Actinoplanes sp. NEAU-A12]|uniref:Rhomboid family intramembrane serine protease n=1 Tax=Actinoplanes sandaracinus TaxID=3045177 RepID=A0ABT6WHJ1_9ACTN|nr:rhomboid family intramembrane serine protease [Actinoplanes sandaracinus]MDI6099203.1 rhomboid family intramembrane serine protease [Actinoplanes sandaracinus]